MTTKTYDHLGSVLFHYDLYPERVESFGKVSKIHTSRGTFALKKTQLSREEGDWFIHVMRRLDRIGFHYVVPVIQTKYGDFLVRRGNDTYYLMPWYEAHERFQHPVSKEDVILEETAKLHGLTEKNQDYSEETIQASFDSLKRRWDHRKLEMERFADQAESRMYMSPFELTFLTHFHRMTQMAEAAEEHLESWVEMCKEKKAFRSVLCHGRLNKSHVLFDQYGSGYFLNFERAVLDTPARELAILFRHYFQSQPWDTAEGIHWLGTYERHFSLFDEERHLLMSYLAFPESVFHSVDLYRNEQREKTQLQLVTHLERRILSLNRTNRLMNTLFQEPHE
ncbi:spore coat protein YsxE [Alteribacter natronophilus]|uniref:spore coat protein YsxE n=1 Tax=Alteribacter natronophilus TaxID=2583810 RepID=UPI00110E670C|nr:spore coat protein YsxE [Alteribacter natronophilus]TMW71606.1 spore coat protein YsxE [Alteribacter natronophilus]